MDAVLKDLGLREVSPSGQTGPHGLLEAEAGVEVGVP